ncbi:MULTISPECIES: glutathione S-transferase C-terminal domain-containing protein [unclassified Ruegeria]|uniref:glutathione S-transferase family protein n=1 Tax=unclassified Ruegeria TaxID=2625375 RepID=UPI001ADB0D2D|nr:MULTISPECIES: glutathione S-transferase C-terminal domain-containing protein [unclassified Ruegeria]MBO9411881.1 glutathione S-transferase C-terminal domain-containing protein [Ruegeria sp. R8_1]MBO9415558.1 glutathione S-transferase C-terminal domain-containing protein [Ruegeria sp. R8_2]
MGVMIAGVYHVDDPAPDTSLDGAYRRQASSIRNALPDGPFGPGRFHLYAAWNCPWAHRVLLTRAVKGLEDVITVAYARPRRTPDGWVYDTEGEYADPLFGVSALHQAYEKVDPAYTGRITVPLLWDRAENRAVSNESADLVRMLGTLEGYGPNLAPPDKLDQIDAWNAKIYPRLNNGVYRAGFARTQEAYEAGFHDVFTMLDEIEAHLATNRYLCGDDLTEADLRLFPTLARFDVAYHYAFRCNLRRLVDYPHLWGYARDLYSRPEIARTVKPDIYKAGYFSPSELRNPLGIVPLGPFVDWSAPQDRAALSSATS